MYNKLAARFQFVANLLVRSLQDVSSGCQDELEAYLDVETLEVGNLVGEASGVVDRTRGHFIDADDIMSESNTMIVFTESGRLMYDTSPAVTGHVFVVEYTESPVLKPLGEVIEQRDISPTLQLAALEGVQDFYGCFFRVLVYGGEEFLVQDEVDIAGLIMYLDVFEVRVYAEPKVARKRPRGSGPRKQRCLWVVDELECDSH